ncbi:lysozyme A/C-like [Pungitius pungitius]|uniref:lysozyme A/C-like n=1 Tax=Pungitius pungitius TaxID=134920 RepID=UPI002E11296D
MEDDVITDEDKETDEVIGTDEDKEGDIVEVKEDVTNKGIDTDGDNSDEGKDVGVDEETGRSRTGLGYYGLFQLSDRYSCDPGSGWSFNKCNTDCEAFIDDNIMDDIDCFVNSGTWLSLLKKPIGQCHRNKNFFDKCE